MIRLSKVSDGEQTLPVSLLTCMCAVGSILYKNMFFFSRLFALSLFFVVYIDSAHYTLADMLFIGAFRWSLHFDVIP